MQKPKYSIKFFDVDLTVFRLNVNNNVSKKFQWKIHNESFVYELFFEIFKEFLYSADYYFWFFQS